MHTVSGAQVATKIESESLPQLIVYTMVKVPAPDTEGSNIPVDGFVIPGPLHTPPGVEETKVIGPSEIHNGPAGHTFASQQTSVY